MSTNTIINPHTGKGQQLRNMQALTDNSTATVNNVGSLRYRADSNNSFFEVVMQTGASTYAWVVIKTNIW